MRGIKPKWGSLLYQQTLYLDLSGGFASNNGHETVLVGNMMFFTSRFKGGNIIGFQSNPIAAHVVLAQSVGRAIVWTFGDLKQSHTLPVCEYQLLREIFSRHQHLRTRHHFTHFPKKNVPKKAWTLASPTPKPDQQKSGTSTVHCGRVPILKTQDPHQRLQCSPSPTSCLGCSKKPQRTSKTSLLVEPSTPLKKIDCVDSSQYFGKNSGNRPKHQLWPQKDPRCFPVKRNNGKTITARPRR